MPILFIQLEKKLLSTVLNLHDFLQQQCRTDGSATVSCSRLRQFLHLTAHSNASLKYF